MGKGSEEDAEFWGAADLPEDFKMSLPADQIKGLGEIFEHHVWWLALLFALLLGLWREKIMSVVDLHCTCPDVTLGLYTCSARSYGLLWRT